MLALISFSVLLSVSSSFTYQVPVRQVESFAFSDDLDYLVVLQGFSASQSKYISLPVKFFKRGAHKYKLIGMENFAVDGFNNPNFVVGKISMDDGGKVFIMANNDNQLRIFKMMEDTFF